MATNPHKRMKKREAKKRRKQVVLSRTLANNLIKFLPMSRVYLDNAILAYKTDSKKEKISVKKLLDFVKKHNKKSFISYVSLFEFRPFFAVANASLKKMVIQGVKEFSPYLIDKKSTQALLAKNKKFFNFLLDCGVDDADAAHFTIAIFSDMELFISFNKRIFKNKKKKIAKELIKHHKKMPLVWNREEIDNILGEFKKNRII